MKTIKSILLLVVISVFTLHVTAQQMFTVFQDNVKPSKAMAYEKIVKEFNKACETHNVETQWLTAAQDDFTYYYITPIDNMAELDKKPMAAMVETMGDTFKDMVKRIESYTTANGSYIIHSVDELSYKAPEGTDTSNQNYRVWYELHYQAENKDEVKESMKAIKAMFEEKNSKEYYNIYHTGFGTMKNYYLVSVAAVDEVDSATTSKINRDVLGPDRYEVFNKLMSYIDQYVEHRGMMRTDLSYMPEKG